jgi:hypothetical protein
MTVQQNISTARARTQELRALPLDGAADRAVDTSVQVAPLVTTPNALGYLKIIVYRRPFNRGRPSERWVSPLGLVDKDDIWYLIGGTENGQRTFPG